MQHYRHVDQAPRQSMWEPLSASWWKHRAEVRADPTHHTRTGISQEHPEELSIAAATAVLKAPKVVQ
jgi:hypothetical protein